MECRKEFDIVVVKWMRNPNLFRVSTVMSSTLGRGVPGDVVRTRKMGTLLTHHVLTRAVHATVHSQLPTSPFLVSGKQNTTDMHADGHDIMPGCLDLTS